MSELARTEGGGAVLRTLPELERDIWMYKRLTAEGIVGIGRALIEAKAQLDRGQWLPWLERVEIKIRSAENYMRVAREILPGSQLAALPYTKALALLDAPEATREQLLSEGVDELSAAEIRRLTKERDQAEACNRMQTDKLIAQGKELEAANAAREKAEKALVEAIESAREQERLAKKHLEARKEMTQAYNILNSQMDDLMKRHPETVEVVPDDYEDLRQAVETLTAQLAEAEEAAEAAEARARDAFMGAPADGDGSDRVTLPAIMRGCNDFLNAVQLYPYHRDEIAAMGSENRRRAEIFVQGVNNWAVRMLSALAEADGAVECEGAVAGV